jgi:hypothetical protein
MDVDVAGHRFGLGYTEFAGDAHLCSGILRYAAGGTAMLAAHAACIPDGPLPRPFAISHQLGDMPVHVLVDAAPPIASVVVVDGRGRLHHGELIEVSPGRPVALVVVPGVRFAGMYGVAGGETIIEVAGGPLTVRGLDAAGTVVAEEVIGVAAS